MKIIEFDQKKEMWGGGAVSKRQRRDDGAVGNKPRSMKCARQVLKNEKNNIICPKRRNSVLFNNEER